MRMPHPDAEPPVPVPSRRHKEADVLSIVYSSSANQAFSSEDLQGLLARSRAANEREGLTGLLMHRDGRFLQLIEGPEQNVRDRMSAIEGDPRHGHLRVLLEDEIQQRQFPDWTMGYESAAGADSGTPGFRRTFDDIDADRSTSGTLPALRALLAWFRERHDA